MQSANMDVHYIRVCVGVGCTQPPSKIMDDSVARRIERPPEMDNMLEIYCILSVAIAHNIVC